MRRTLVTHGLLATVVLACHEAPAPPPAVPPPPSRPANPQVEWDRLVSVYDVLGRDPAALSLVQVRRRSLPAGVQSAFGDVNELGPGSPPFRVVTVCGDRFCADGLVTRHQATITPSRNPCMGTAERSAPWITVLPARCDFTVGPALSVDERERLGDDAGSWLERGIMVVSGDDAHVSFFVASAWFTAGAAHSSASFECRTSDRRGQAKSLAEVLPADRARTVVDRARAFLTEQRELDGRATLFQMPAADPGAVRDFVVPGDPRSDVLLCLGSDIEGYAGHAQLVRVR